MTELYSTFGGFYPMISPTGRFVLAGNGVLKLIDLQTKTEKQIAANLKGYLRGGWYSDDEILIQHENDSDLYRYVVSTGILTPWKIGEYGGSAFHVSRGHYEVCNSGVRLMVDEREFGGNHFETDLSDELCVANYDSEKAVRAIDLKTWKITDHRPFTGPHRVRVKGRYIGYGYHGPSWVIEPNGTQLQVNLTKGEGPGVVVLAPDGTPWVLTPIEIDAKKSLWMRPLGHTEKTAIQMDGVAERIDAVAVGDKVIVAGHLTNGLLKIFEARFNEVLKPIPLPVVPPIVVKPVTRACLFGGYVFGGKHMDGLKYNCELRVVQPTATEPAPMSFLWQGEVRTHTYVAGNPDGNLASLEKAIKAARSHGLPVIAYWPRSLQVAPNSPVPSADVIAIEMYQQEPTIEAWKARCAASVHRCKKAIMVAQCYTSNAGNTANLVPLIPHYSDLLNAWPRLMACLLFSGAGRATGLEQHPEVLPYWKVIADSVRTPEIVIPPPKPTEPPVPPVVTPTTMQLLAHTGKYVCAEETGINDQLKASRDKAQGWETFSIVPQNDGTFGLKSAHGKFVSAQDDTLVIANRDACNSWERFRKIVLGPDGAFALQRDGGKFLRVDPTTGLLFADRTAIGPHETFGRPTATVPPTFPVEPPVEPPTGPVTARRGQLRGNGAFGFMDDDGPLLLTGQTLFHGFGSFARERAFYEEDLETTKRISHFNRMIVCGLRFGTNERSLDPKDPKFKEHVTGAINLSYDGYGIRVGTTIFGAQYPAPTEREQLEVVDMVAEATIAAGKHKTAYVEIANEGWTNGFVGDAGRDRLFKLAKRFAEKCPNVLLATTCPAAADDITKAGVQYYYLGSVATVLTEHHARSEKPPDGIWRHTKKPRREGMKTVQGCPSLRINQEPWGPESSGDEGNDPLVLAIDATVTWIVGEGGYLLHCGAGIHGLDNPRNPGPGDDRPARIKNTENYDAICTGIEACRGLLDPEVPNWTKFDSFGGSFTFEDVPDEQFAACYSAEKGGRIVKPVWGVVKTTTWKLKNGTVNGRVHDPRTGAVISTFDKQFTVTPAQRAVLVIAERTS